MDSVSASNYSLWSSENADGQSLNESSASGSLIRFFFPTSKFLFYFIPPSVLVLKTVVKCLGGSVVYWYWSDIHLSFNPDSALCLRQDNLWTSMSSSLKWKCLSEIIVKINWDSILRHSINACYSLYNTFPLQISKPQFALMALLEI